MKKFLVILTCFLAVGGVGGSVFFGIKWNIEKSEREVLIRQNGELQKSIDGKLECYKKEKINLYDMWQNGDSE